MTDFVNTSAKPASSAKENIPRKGADVVALLVITAWMRLMHCNTR